MENPMGINIRKPVLSWICDGGIRQSAYEVTAVCDGSEIFCTGKVNSSRMQVTFDAVQESRMRVTWKVRLWDEKDEVGEWSEEAYFETGLLKTSDWSAQWINPEIVDNGQDDEGVIPVASYLRKSFAVENFGSARLYITAHGLYAAYINGKPVTKSVLNPGTAEYEKYLPVQTYDVTELLKEGENEILAALGNGWYRGTNGNEAMKNIFGKDIALLCQLETDGQMVVCSDESWQASQSGPIRENDLKQGETYDANMENIAEWHEVIAAEFGYENLCGMNTVPVTEHETFRGRLITTPNGETVIDFGQNMSGYIQIEGRFKAGERIRLVHGETLDENGNFTIANFQNAKIDRLTSAQEVNFTAREGYNDYRPTFTVCGFQYVLVESDADLTDVEFTAHAVYSDMEQIGWFTCSDERVNQLVKNTVWSEKSNFVGVPTDCPTRERAGYTGDAGAFTPTGIYLMDAYPVLSYWLRQLQCCQTEEGIAPGVAPRVTNGGGMAEMFKASSGWGDACIAIPYYLYHRTGDVAYIRENYEMMKRWLVFCENRAKQCRPGGQFEHDEYKDYIVDTGAHWGEWLEPGRSVMDVMTEMGRKGMPEVATAYYARSAQLFSEMATVLGEEKDAEYYRDIFEKAKRAYQNVASGEKTLEEPWQCKYVRPLHFGLLEGEEEIAEKLNKLVVENGYHLNTGFLSTPHLCHVLTCYGYLETAYRLLLQDTAPSWLYAVSKGANTIWENWEGRSEDGQVKDSFNHYSFGSVVGWLFEDVAGITLDDGHITIAPKPYQLLGHVKAVYDSPVGRIESSWKYEGEKISYRVVIPANGNATVVLPDGRIKEVAAGEYNW